MKIYLDHIGIACENLEDSSTDEETYENNRCCKWISRFYFIGTPFIALILLILASLNIWSDDNLKTCITIISCIYIMCHWVCYVVKC